MNQCFEVLLKCYSAAPCTPFHSKYRLHTAVTIAHISAPQSFFIRRSTALLGEITGPNVPLHCGTSVAYFLKSKNALTITTVPPPTTSLKDS